MAEILADLTRRTPFAAVAEHRFDAPLFGPEQARHDAQQRRFSRPVAPCQDHRLAGRQLKGNINENQVFAALGGNVFGDQPHGLNLPAIPSSPFQKIVRIRHSLVWHLS
ncbi:hypothetical protein D3C72_2003410 [compost metagenome]